MITPIIPDHYFKVNSVEKFLEKLPEFDEEFEHLYQSLCQANEKLIYQASFNEEEIKVELKSIGEHHSFYRIPGGQNAVIICSERYRKFPLIISAQSSEPEIVAGVIFADLVRAAIR